MNNGKETYQAQFRSHEQSLYLIREELKKHDLSRLRVEYERCGYIPAICPKTGKIIPVIPLEE
jgi:hypothetical protein